MLGTLLGKKKLTEEAVSELMVNSILNAVATNFPDVTGLINDDVDFVERPNIEQDDGYQFLLIILTGNICFIPKFFESGKDKRIIEYIISYASDVLGYEKRTFAKDISECKKMMSRINYPSKNTVYAMSKAIFYRYDLNDFQEKYFKTLRSPNPKFLKRMDDVVKLFIFNWAFFLEKHKVA